MYRTLFTSLCCLVLFTAPLHAAFILDDFDDPAEVVAPAMLDEFLETEHVGAINATRSIRIADFGFGDPEGYLDSSLTSSSLLTGHIKSLNHGSANESSGAAIQTNYVFPPTDFTQSDTNDAFFFDFVQLTSEIPPSLFKIILSDGNNYFSYLDTSDYRNSTRFTVVVPFDVFTIRGGAPGLPDYSALQSFNFEIRASHIAGGGPDPLNFFVELDRIRVGRIPEPHSLWLGIFGSVVLMGSRLPTVRSLKNGGCVRWQN